MVLSHLCYSVLFATLCTFPSRARPVQEHGVNSTGPNEVEIIVLGKHGERYKTIVPLNNDSLNDNTTLEKPFCSPVALHENFWYIQPERGRVVYTPEAENEKRIPLYTKAHLECEAGFEPTHTDDLLATEVFCAVEEAAGGGKRRARWMPPGNYLGNCASIGILRESTTPDGSGFGDTETTMSSGTDITEASGSGTSLLPCPTTPGQTQSTTVDLSWYDSSGSGSGEDGSTATPGAWNWFDDSSGSGSAGVLSTTQSHDSTATTAGSNSGTTTDYSGSGYASSPRGCIWPAEEDNNYVGVVYPLPEPVQQPAVQTFEGLSGMLKALPLPINAFAP